MHARRTISLIGCRELRPDMGGKNHVIALVQTGLAVFSRIITTDADSHHPAYAFNGHCGLVRIDELVSHRLVSLTKKAVVGSTGQRNDCF